MRDKSFYKFFYIVGIILLAGCGHQKEVSDNAKYIDPFICTGSDHGQADPAASVPFGMVKLCPDTDPIAHSGYDYDAKEIIGFSHNRFSGVGCKGAGGNIRVLPFLNHWKRPEKLPYDKSTEKAESGYYSVVLDNKVKVQLTASDAVGFHKYTFINSGIAGIAVDFNSSFEKTVSNTHRKTTDGYIVGSVSSQTVCQEGNYKMYFALKTDIKGAELTNTDSTLLFTFDIKNGDEVNLRCALSVVDEEHALGKLKEAESVNFDEAKQQAFNTWNKFVNVIEVETSDKALKRNFYTHLYHVGQSPFKVSEKDGKYRGSDGKEYTNKELNYYFGWSIWDTFRSKLPLLSFLYPEYYADMMSSVAELYKQGKKDWATKTEPFITVRTEHSIITLLEASRKGLLDFSLDDIYPQLVEESNHFPFKSPDNVLESSYDLWALSEIAKDLGFIDDHKDFLKRAMDYRSIWKEKFMVMDDKSDIMHGDGLYEGTLWQYRWLVPFDIMGIQNLMGGKDVFERDLDYFFNNELFNIGNQPDIQVPYLYAYTDSPWKTDELVNKLLTEETNNWYGTHRKWKKPEVRKIFNDTPHGYISQMDDDAGTMSAWYVWSTLGLYPVFPGDTKLVVVAPQFDKSTIKLSGKNLIIERNKLTPDSKYITKIKFNGTELTSRFIDFNQLVNGGLLRITMGEHTMLY